MSRKKHISNAIFLPQSLVLLFSNWPTDIEKRKVNILQKNCEKEEKTDIEGEKKEWQTFFQIHAVLSAITLPWRQQTRWVDCSSKNENHNLTKKETTNWGTIDTSKIDIDDSENHNII